MPFLSKIVNICQHWILFVWHIAPEIDDGRCSQCQPLVLFVQVLEKTLWTLKTLLTETFCMQNARLPCETKPPEWARALFSGMKNPRINCPTHIQNHFQGFWLFHVALAVYPDPGKSFQNAASAWRYGTYFGPDHLLGLIIDRFPKLFFWAIYQGPWLELKIFCLGQFAHVTSVPDRTHSYLILIFSRQRKDRHFSTEPSEQVSATSRKAKTLHGPSSFPPPGGNSDAFMEAPV